MINYEELLKDDLSLPAELVVKELVSNNASCNHRSSRDKFTILLEKTGYRCTKCGETHDKLADFFAENMAQRQLKAEEDKKLK